MTEEKRISRRELLKLLAATGGAVAASSILPDEWTGPLVETGVLPAHAQISEVDYPALTVRASGHLDAGHALQGLGDVVVRKLADVFGGNRVLDLGGEALVVDGPLDTRAHADDRDFFEKGLRTGVVVLRLSDRRQARHEKRAE